MKFISIGAVLAIAALSTPFAAQADSRKAYCRYFPDDSKTATVSMPCVFSMSQGNVGITWEDGASDYFLQRRDVPTDYTDERGGYVYQRRRIDSNGQTVRMFKMENGSIHIWGS